MKNFRTKTEIVNKDNKTPDGKWVIGLDIGYSAVKLFAPNKYGIFPSYAKRIDKNFQFAGKTPDEAILYENLDNGDIWIVGEVAQNLIKPNDTSDSESSLYGRERYDSPIFKVVTEVGLGIALLNNDIASYVDQDIVVQTGLPERYLEMDSDKLLDSFSGKHHFRLKIGENEWQTFFFELKESQIDIMSQPKGTLFSISIKQNGIPHPDYVKYMKSSLLIIDPGFGTLDIFPISSGVVSEGETYEDLGMKRILQEVSQKIKADYKMSIPVPAMQKYLQDGEFPVFDRKKMEARNEKLDGILGPINHKICMEAIERILEVITDIYDYNYIVITGGTGAAWYNYICDKFKGLANTQIIPSNQNDTTLSFVYSNVRGYYEYRKMKSK